MITGLTIFVAVVGIFAAFHLGWRKGLQDGIAEGKYLEARRHSFFHRQEDKPEL